MLQEIYKVGARKVAVFGAPPLGCVPYMRRIGGGEQNGCAEDQNEAMLLYNSKLSSMLTSLTPRLLQSKVIYVNMYDPLFNIIQNPHKYGKHNFYFIVFNIYIFLLNFDCCKN